MTRHAGLWALLEKDLNKRIIGYWCSGHRSDLALEDVSKIVPEFRRLRQDFSGKSNFFRGSGVRTKHLRDIAQKEC